MTEFDSHDGLPEEFRGVADSLRDSRPAFSQLELDKIKLRAVRQAKRGRTRRRPMVSRWATVGLATVLLGGGAATGLANSGGAAPKITTATIWVYYPVWVCTPRAPLPWGFGSSGFEDCKWVIEKIAIQVPVPPPGKPPLPPPFGFPF
jgi:hypothetical protein